MDVPVVLFLLLLLLFTTVDAATAAAGSPPARKDVEPLRSFKPGGHYLMLTFNNAPHATMTPRLLDALKAKNVSATFFVSGLKALDHPHLVRRMVAEGHEVALHGWNLKPFPSVKRENLPHQLVQAAAVVRNISLQVPPSRLANPLYTVHYPAVVRPPGGGATSPDINTLIAERTPLKVVLWSLDAKDKEQKSAAAIEKAVVDKAKPGDVVLLHDGLALTAAALPPMLQSLLTTGYEMLTLSQMISFPDDSPHR